MTSYLMLLTGSIMERTLLAAVRGDLLTAGSILSFITAVT